MLPCDNFDNIDNFDLPPVCIATRVAHVADSSVLPSASLQSCGLHPCDKAVACVAKVHCEHMRPLCSC